jgi:hypothetical protein
MRLFYRKAGLKLNRLRFLNPGLTLGVVFTLIFVSMSAMSVGQSIASLELGTTSLTSNTTGAATFTTKDANISSLPALTLTAGQQGQAGGTGFVSSKTWNNTTQNTSTYWSFSLTANSGYTLSVTSITLKGQRSGTGPTNVALRSDADSYVGNISTQSGLQSNSANIVFSGLTLSNKTTITFRVYGWEVSGGGAGGTWRIGDGSAASLDIDVQGSVTATCTPPTPTFTTTPSASLCANSFATYTTQSGQSAYTWSLPGTSGSDYLVTAGGTSSTDNSVTVRWLTIGTKNVTVGYTTAGCASVSPASNSVSVTANSQLPPTGSNSQSFCSGGTVADLAATGTSIQWYTTAAITIQSPLATNNALANGHYYATQTVGGCESSVRLDVFVAVTIPAQPGSISGPMTVVQSSTSNAYSISSVADATGYSWSYTASGASITPSSIDASVDFNTTATSGNLQVAGTNACGTGTAQLLAITVNPSLPEIDIQSPTGTSIGSGGSTAAFGSFAWGSNNDFIFRVLNTGTAALSVSSISFSGTNAGDFSVVTPPSYPLSVAGAGQYDFTVRFTPGGIGSRTATIRFTNSDGDEGTYDINIPGTGTVNNLADITFNSGSTASVNQNIDYSVSQSATISNTGSGANGSIGVMGFTVRDGGATVTDADNLPTILTGISFNVTNAANIRSAALFNGSTFIATVAVGGTSPITFTGLSGVNVTCADNGTLALNLRVTFNATVIDNQKMVFTVASATAAGSSTSSLFAAANAGGAVSENTVGDINRIEVTATKLAFVQGPSGATNGVAMSPAITVKGLDANDNQDLDFNTPVTIACSTPAALTTNPSPVTPSSGMATFNALVHTLDGTYTMTASASGLSPATSGSYVISTFTYVSGDFRPKYATDLSYNGDWEYYNGSSWIAVPDAKAPQNTTTTVGRIIIDKYVTGGGSASKAYNCDFIVQSGGELVLLENDAPPVLAEMVAAAKKLEVLAGGILTVQGDIDVAATGKLIIRSGGQMILDQPSINNIHPIWEGIETFEGGSTVTLKDWDWTVSAVNRSLINISTTITSNANGWKFGNFVFSATPTDTWTIIGGGIGIINLCENNLEITNYSTNRIGGISNKTGTNGFVVNGNMTIYDGPFAFSTTFSNDPFNHQATVNGNFTCSTNDALQIHSNSTNTVTGQSGFVTFKGNITVASSVTSFTNDPSSVADSRMYINLDGGSSGSPLYVDISPTLVATSVNVKASRYIRLANSNLTVNSVVSNTAIFTVEGLATLHFGWNSTGTTPLIIRTVTPGSAGTNKFSSASTSILIITSVDGIQQVSAVSGNVQMVTSNKIFGDPATYWYVGKTSQATGDGLTSGPSGKVIIVDLIDNTTTLTLSQSTVLTNNTTASTTGGKLDIRSGQFIETTTAYIDGSSGTLYMSGGTLYRIAKGNATAAAAYTDLIPRMNGGSYPYILSGGTIEFAGTGAGHYFQVLRSNSNLYHYKYLSFTGSNSAYTGGGSPTDYKGLSDRTDVDSAVSISNNAVVNCISTSGSAAPLAGDGGLVMTGGWLMMKKLNVTSPELTANNAGTSYALNGGTIEFYGSGATQQQQIRGNYGVSSTTVSYYNLELNAAAANYNSTIANAGNVDLSSSFNLQNIMNVNSPAVLRMDKDESISGSGNFKVNSGGGLLYGGSEGTPASAIEGLEASGTTVNSGNIRTTNRSLSTGASYGFVSLGDMPTGSGLPATAQALYTYKTNTTDKVTFTNPVLVSGTGSLLNLTSGVLVTTSTNLITLKPEAIVSGGSTNSFVSGPLAKQTDATNTPVGTYEFSFPVGKTLPSLQYKPCYVLPATAVVTTTYTGEFFPANPAATYPDPFSGTLVYTYKNHYWKVDRAGAGTARVALDYTPGNLPTDWVASGGSPSPASIPSNTNVAVVKNFGTYWDFTKTPVNFNDQGPLYEARYYTTTGKIYTDVLNSFSPFTFGFDYNTILLLPVKLLSFTGQLVVADGRLNWKIDNARDLDGFELEYSTDGHSYKKLADVQASVSTTYSFLHKQLPAGANYYRLLVRDKKGKTYYSQVVLLNVGKLHTYLVGLTPTVVSGELIPVVYSANKQTIHGIITDVLGRRILSYKTQLEPGSNQWRINTSTLAKGMYFISLFTDDGFKETKRFLKE